MAEEILVLEFSDDNIHGEVFGFASIPDRWWEGDDITEVDHLDIIVAVIDSSAHLEEDEFEGGPGMSDTYYKVYAHDKEKFRSELTAALLELLEAGVN